MKIPAEFLVERQGKSFVLYAGLINEAHKQGLARIETEAVTVTATLAFFKATVTMESGKVFVGYGDATPDNVGRNIAPHFIRMAETRAKARALRDALNIGVAALEELGDDDEPGPARQPVRQQAPPPAQRRPADMDDVEAQGNADDAFEGLTTAAQPKPAANGDRASEAQLRAIHAIAGGPDAARSRSVGLFRLPPEELTKRQASQLIDALKSAQR